MWKQGKAQVPFLNPAHVLSCNKCSLPKGKVFLRNFTPEKPSMHTKPKQSQGRASEESDAAALRKRVQDLEKQLAASARADRGEAPEAEAAAPAKADGEAEFQAKSKRAQELDKNYQEVLRMFGEGHAVTQLTKQLRDTARADRDLLRSPSALVHSAQRALEGAKKRAKAQEAELEAARQGVVAAVEAAEQTQAKLSASKLEVEAMQVEFNRVSAKYAGGEAAKTDPWGGVEALAGALPGASAAVIALKAALEAARREFPNAKLGDHIDDAEMLFEKDAEEKREGAEGGEQSPAPAGMEPGSEQAPPAAAAAAAAAPATPTGPARAERGRSRSPRGKGHEEVAERLAQVFMDSAGDLAFIDRDDLRKRCLDCLEGRDPKKPRPTG